MMVNIPKIGDAQLYGYAYDQLNRIMSMDAFGGFNNTNNTWTNTNPAASSNYKERVTYDANGNIKTYLRNGTIVGGTPLAMDNLTYNYNTSGGKLVNNRLRHVQDAIGDANYTDDVDNQSADNYSYDAIGNLKTDIKEGITNITWSVYGKILSVTKASGTITYTYDAGGNRISKTYNGKITWYVRDAGGNVMGVYEQRSDLNSGRLTQTEAHLYGSSRLGINNINRDMVNPPTGEITTFERGRKFFELTNHLGSVLVTISDKKIGVDQNTDGTVDYYTADVISAQDFYPFGQLMPGRQYGALGRYGFNGKEQDPETKGSGAQYDYGFRIYDPRLGKFLSVDPLTRNFPMLTPYQYASNNPVEGVDLDGLEYVSSKKVRIEVIYGRVKLKLDNMTTVVKNSLKAYNEDPKNWKPGEIGVDFSVGSISLQKAAPQTPSSDPDPNDANPNANPGETKVEKPIAKSTGQPDRRFKDRTVTTASPGGAKGLALLSVGIDIVIAGANLYVQNRIEKDEGLINQHIGLFKLAAADVNYALKYTDLIPPELQTEQYISDIINVVLSGESITKQYHPKEGAKVLEIGMKIYNTLSIKRKEYTGRVIETSKLDNYSNRIMEKNPAYDPEYVKENPPLGEKPKQ
jgi:RHS repeat-associated protein